MPTENFRIGLLKFKKNVSIVAEKLTKGQMIASLQRAIFLIEKPKKITGDIVL